MNDKISIIVPIYNTEKYLNRCIESIINQTYKNLQIILIDDGSTDNSAKICEEYSKKDDRILFIGKENTGVSDTRNLGIKKASGKYIGFVDSDDFVQEYMFEKLYNNIVKYDVDMSICEYEENIRNKEIKLLNSNELLECILGDKGPGGFLWNKLYKKSIIEENNILLNKKIYICEDLLFNCEYIEKVNKAVSINEKLYNYVYREDSASNKKINSKWLTVLDAYDEMDKIYKNKDKKTYDVFLWFYVLMNINTKSKMYLGGYKNENDIKRCNKIIKLYIKEVLKSKNISFKMRLKVFIYYYFHSIINILKKICGKV